MSLGWANRVYVVVLSAMILGAAALLPAFWFHWPSPVAKAASIGTGWIVIGLLLPWAEQAPDRPHRIVLTRSGWALGRRAVTIIEVAIVGVVLWLLLY
jgi:hypothetical protein